MHFDWDPKKAAANVKNHDGVTFDEAETVFGDPVAAVFLDEDHSWDEKREIITGIRANKDFWLFVSQNVKIRSES